MTEQPNNTHRHFDALFAFREVCLEFDRQIITKSLEGMISPLALYKNMFFHPIQAIRDISTLQSRVSKTNIIDGVYPVDQVLEYLRRYNNNELVVIKKLTEINLAKRKTLVKENPILILTTICGIIYTATKIGTSQLEGSEYFEWLFTLLKLDFITTISDVVFIGLLIGIWIVPFEYIFYFLPNLHKAQNLDDILSIAVENSKLESCDQCTSNA